MIVRHAEKPTKANEQFGMRLGLPVHSHWRAGSEDELAAGLAERGGTVLVSWHHEAIPTIARALGACAAPEEWPDDRFDVVWTLTRVDAGWRFAQVPKLLLAGDLPNPIG